MIENFLLVNAGVAGMRCKKLIVKSAEQRLFWMHDRVLIDAGELFGKQMLLNAVMIIQTCLCAPADMERGVNMGFGPFHDLRQLVPVIHLLEVHFLDRSTGDDKTVIVIVLDFIKGGIELEQMILRRVGGLIGAGLHQIHLDLKRSVGKAAQDLRFSSDFGRHEIEQGDAQRTNILCHRAVLRHYKNVLALKNCAGRQTVLYFNRHEKRLLFQLCRVQLGLRFQL